MVDLVFKDSEKKHQYHLVNPSPWPLVGAFSALFLVSGAILYMHYEMWWPLIVGFMLILFTFFMWWRDIIKGIIRMRELPNDYRLKRRSPFYHNRHWMIVIAKNQRK